MAVSNVGSLSNESLLQGRLVEPKGEVLERGLGLILSPGQVLQHIAWWVNYFLRKQETKVQTPSR